MMVDTIEARLSSALNPESLRVDNESAQHAGHAGYTDGESHFRVTVVSPLFRGCSRVARHRLVYHALADLMPLPIHALAIVALSPEEVSPAVDPPASVP
jgi:BolA family transcriptional regulator, general stress-responsive regulator